MGWANRRVGACLVLLTRRALPPTVATEGPAKVQGAEDGRGHGRRQVKEKGPFSSLEFFTSCLRTRLAHRRTPRAPSHTAPMLHNTRLSLSRSGPRPRAATRTRTRFSSRRSCTPASWLRSPRSVLSCFRLLVHRARLEHPSCGFGSVFGTFYCVRRAAWARSQRKTTQSPLFCVLPFR